MENWGPQCSKALVELPIENMLFAGAQVCFKFIVYFLDLQKQLLESG